MLEESLNINFEGSFYYKGILQMQDEITLDQREGLNIGESSQSLNEAGSYDINSMRTKFSGHILGKGYRESYGHKIHYKSRA